MEQINVEQVMTTRNWANVRLSSKNEFDPIWIMTRNSESEYYWET